MSPVYLPVDGGDERGFGNARARLRARKLSEIVAQEIVHDIAARRLPPNTMLPAESAMLEQYGVGRASLREALRVLEVQGLIVMKPGPGGGPMVAGVESRHFGKMTTLYLHLTGSTFSDVLQARMVLEPVMVRLAAERADPDHLRRLDEFLASPQPSPDMLPSEHLSASTEFHAMVSSMSGNPVLDLFARATRDIYVDRQHGLTFPEPDRQRVLDEHVEIARAIRDGRAEIAERLMRVHMEEFGRYSASRHPGMLDEIVDWR
ncbi:MAG TPA: FCD domain-containing protein [Acidimicrobiales bacterium]|nr:FCD domain-containing protein [Acidimicrobiales bacterium]